MPLVQRAWLKMRMVSYEYPLLDCATLSIMSLLHVLSSIDDEISRLQQARALLNGSGTSTRGKKSAATQPVNGKRVISPESRKRMADAQRKRWAPRKKATK